MRKVIVSLFALLMGMIFLTGPQMTAEEQDTTDLYIHKYFGLVEDPHDGTELPSEELPDMPVIRNVVFDVYPILETADFGEEWQLSRIGGELIMSQKGRIITLSLGEAIRGTTDDNGQIIYPDLPTGNYYIEENLSASDPQIMKYGQWNSVPIYEGMKSFVLETPMKDPVEPTKNLKEIHIYPKNHDEDPGKEVSEPSVALGEEVTWRIYADLPAKLPDYIAYRLVDELDERLEFLPETLVVKNNGVTIEAGRDYTVDFKDRLLTVELTEHGRKTLTKRIELFFDTKVHTRFPVVGENEIYNKAEIQFNNEFYLDPEQPGRHPLEGEDPNSPSYPLVNTGDIVIDKQDNAGAALKGAEFQLSRTEQGDYLRLVVDPQKQAVKRVALDDTLTKSETDRGYQLWDWVVRPHEPTVVFTEGVVYTPHFDGLKTHQLTADKQSKVGLTYFVHETKAPAGYQQLPGAVKVDFEKDGGVDQENHQTYIIEKAVVNQPSSKEPLRPYLPQTGMEVTIWLSGLGLVILSAVILLKHRRQS